MNPSFFDFGWHLGKEGFSINFGIGWNWKYSNAFIELGLFGIEFNWAHLKRAKKFNNKIYGAKHG